MSDDLANRSCVPCRGGVLPLDRPRVSALLELLENGWHNVDCHHLEKEFHFKDFREALAFTNRVGAVAEEQNHHPDILTAWGKVTVRIWTHTANGLTENDFILAAKVDRALQPH